MFIRRCRAGNVKRRLTVELAGLAGGTGLSIRRRSILGLTICRLTERGGAMPESVRGRPELRRRSVHDAPL